ncbi:MAG TPA: hypothetical protein VK762_06705, partial [Polyangiaceae bacterium]|nr:hypothetical protein [Polyangiaceae bacterium]
MTARIHFVVAAMGAALALAGAPARADEAMRVAVIGAGTDGDAIASVVASRLTSPVMPADPDAFRAALGAATLRTLAAATKRHDKDVELVARLRAAARTSHADRAVVIHVDKAKSRTLVHVWLVDAQGSGSALVDDDSHLGGGATLGDEADAAWNAVSGAFAPPPQEPAAAPAAESAPVAPSGPALDVSPRPSDADTGVSS